MLTSPYVRDGIPVNQEQMDYVAATLNAAGIPSQHSTLNYAKVNSEHHYSKITPHWFMLTIPYLGHGSAQGANEDATHAALQDPRVKCRRHPRYTTKPADTSIQAALLGVPSLLRPRLEDHWTQNKNKGITLTPDKKQPSLSPSNTTSWTPTPGRSDQSLYINTAMSDAQGPPLPVPSPEADPAPKRRPAKRKTPEAAPDITLDPELLRQGNPKGQQVPLPTSLTDKVFKAWLHERTLSNHTSISSSRS